ncbi:MAG: hypothetical protein SX243_14680 [Acidobacteriota bacterium]|nr:hypothetical protein [Acidobacteriota bacterium]
MGVRSYLMVSAVLFALVGGLHLVRVIEGWAFQFGPFDLPAGLSVLAVIVPWGLAVWAVRLSSRLL